MTASRAPIPTLAFNQTQFVKSAASCDQLPVIEGGREIAVCGRSNAGKSSALNAIIGIRGIARTSKTPGRTQLMNLFKVSDAKHLVDLPGYGYAKVAAQVKYQWEQHLSEYIETRPGLLGVLLVMDIRHPLKPFDKQMIEWVCHHGLAVHILLTKADKLKRHAANQTLLAVQRALSGYQDWVTVQLFSATQAIGLEQARQHLSHWFSVQWDRA